MKFALDEDQRSISDLLQRFVQEHYEYSKRRRLVAAEPGYSPQHWQRFTDLGLLGLSLPAESGGLNLDFTYTALVMEWLGRGLVVEPYFSSVVLAGGVLKYAPHGPRRSDCLAALCEGTLLLALAHEESGSEGRVQQIATRARAQAGGYVVSGTKQLVLHGPSADRFVVSACKDGSLLLFLLDARQAGIELTPYRTVDGLPACDLILREVTVERAQVLAEGESAQAILRDVVTEAIAALCAEAVGCMQALFDITLDYVKQRKQFGRALGSFQVIQHRLADCFVDLEQSRSMALLAANSVAAGAVDRHRSVAAAKAFIGEASLRMGHEAIQLHGGMGMTEELSVGGYHKRLLVIQSVFGDVDQQIERFNQFDDSAPIAALQKQSLAADANASRSTAVE